MATSNFGLLSQAEEDALHNASRLLSVEIRPYQRLSSRLLKADSLLHARQAQLVTPPPDASAADEEAAAKFALEQKQVAELDEFCDNVILDSKLLDMSILRMKFSGRSNETERERYKNKKEHIQKTSQSIRDNTVELRANLEAAKDMLAQRKKYDELTEKITSSKVLKARDEQAISHAKLDEEINELQEEVEGFKKMWAERRGQFSMLVGEGRLMLSKIKEDKEEAERKDMMNDGDDVEDGEGSTTRELSHVGTPRPDPGNATPVHVQDAENAGYLKVPRDRLAPVSRSPSVAPSVKGGLSVGGDKEQDHETTNSEQQHANNDSDSMESGEEAEDGMDTT